MKNIIITLTLLLSFSLYAQYNPEAKKYLDDVAAHLKTEQGLNIGFEVKISHIQSNEQISNTKGKLLIKGDLHKLILEGAETYGDGENQWVHLIEEEEVTIQPLEEGEVTPASIFTIYQEGYKFRILGEDDERVIIELSPEEREVSDYIRVTLYIDKKDNRIDAFSAQSKTGHITNINITSWENKTIENDVLVFDKTRFPNVEIIDLR